MRVSEILKENSGKYNYLAWKVIKPEGLVNLAEKLRAGVFLYDTDILNRNNHLHITWNFGLRSTDEDLAQMQQDVFQTSDIKNPQEASVIEYAYSRQIHAFRVVLHTPNGDITTQKKGGKFLHITMGFNSDSTIFDPNKSKEVHTKPVHSYLLFENNNLQKYQRAVDKQFKIIPLQ